nr:mitotic-spindle organizing protein 2 isoform X1 [Danio rerio]|eukprot:XP_021324488.1 mitotic-spindle organizing protein 2 isoform X1 [Danio rerio]
MNYFRTFLILTKLIPASASCYSVSVSHSHASPVVSVICGFSALNTGVKCPRSASFMCLVDCDSHPAIESCASHVRSKTSSGQGEKSARESSSQRVPRQVSATRGQKSTKSSGSSSSSSQLTSN